ncbi:MAG: trigger factor family protein, partial [Ruminococcus sp.]|nr:trigger factor family protein [Ruminococcus sp.]
MTYGMSNKTSRRKEIIVKILDKKIDQGNLSVTLRIEPHEFERALQDAYLENTERFVVPGYAAGLAPRAKIEEIYGVTALFDEALDLCVPAMYNQFLSENNIRIIGSPQLTEVTWQEGGGASFTVT